MYLLLNIIWCFDLVPNKMFLRCARKHWLYFVSNEARNKLLCCLFFWSMGVCVCNDLWTFNFNNSIKNYKSFFDISTFKYCILISIRCVWCVNNIGYSNKFVYIFFIYFLFMYYKLENRIISIKWSFSDDTDIINITQSLFQYKLFVFSV